MGWKERTDSYKLPFDLHVCAMVCKPCKERNPTGGGRGREEAQEAAAVEIHQQGTTLHTHNLSSRVMGHSGKMPREASAGKASNSKNIRSIINPGRKLADSPV